MPGLGIIANPNSKTFRQHPEKMEKLFDIVSDRAVFRATKDTKDIRQAAKDYKEMDIDLLAINGGDGTVRLTLGQFIEEYDETELPPIAILPTGTMNTTGASLGIKSNSLKLLPKLLDKYDSDHVFSVAERNILKINDEYGFIFGNGFFYRFLKIYYEKAYPSMSKTLGLLTKVSFSTMLKSSLYKEIFKSFPIRLEIDGHDVGTKEYSCIACSSIPYIGLGFYPFPKSLERKNAFHLLGFPPRGKSLLKNLPRFFFGKEAGKDIFQAVAGTTKIKTPEPIGYQLDGELKVSGSEVCVAAGPRLKLISGKNYL